MQILMVEDDPTVSQSVVLMLQSDTCALEAAALGHEGVELAKLNGYDLILLDLDLPDLSGYEVLRALRAAGIDTPVLVLSGLSTVANKVKALEFGADDYLTKPFHKDELLARVHAVMRRADVAAEQVVRCGDLAIYLEANRVEIAGQPVGLTKKEFEVLELLALRQGTAISKEMFLSHLYGGMDEPGLKIIDVFLCKLRKKLAAVSGGVEYIETVWGRGYMLQDRERLRGAA